MRVLEPWPFLLTGHKFVCISADAHIWLTCNLAAHGNPLWVPFQTIMNYLMGYVASIGIYMGLYYSNAWNSRRLPFLSQLMYSDKSTSAKYIKYNQTAILDSNYRINSTLLEKQHLPVLAASHIFGMIMVSIGTSAAIVHMILWHWPDLKSAFPVKAVFSRIINVKSWTYKFWKGKAVQPTDEEADEIDPHYRLMMAYSDVPSWWFGLLWVVSAVVGLITSRLAKSDLEWWAFLAAISLSAIILPFFAAMNAIFGFKLNIQPLMQMVGGYMLPGRPLANLYFATFGYNSLYQAKLLLQDLKLGQYVHLAPKCTFVTQMVGTVIGCCLSYAMMEKITTEKRDILLAIQGTNIWSGQKVQKENSAVSCSFQHIKCLQLVILTVSRQ
jgi:OPT family oligopeptide transporter